MSAKVIPFPAAHGKKATPATPTFVRDPLSRWDRLLSAGDLSPSALQEAVDHTPCIAIAGIGIGIRLAASLYDVRVLAEMPEIVRGPSLRHLQRLVDEERQHILPSA